MPFCETGFKLQAALGPGLFELLYILLLLGASSVAYYTMCVSNLLLRSGLSSLLYHLALGWRIQPW